MPKYKVSVSATDYVHPDGIKKVHQEPLYVIDKLVIEARGYREALLCSIPQMIFRKNDVQISEISEWETAHEDSYNAIVQGARGEKYYVMLFIPIRFHRGNMSDENVHLWNNLTSIGHVRCTGNAYEFEIVAPNGSVFLLNFKPSMTSPTLSQYAGLPEIFAERMSLEVEYLYKDPYDTEKHGSLSSSFLNRIVSPEGLTITQIKQDIEYIQRFIFHADAFDLPPLPRKFYRDCYKFL